jgi:chaperonin cofactor prefoldin
VLDWPEGTVKYRLRRARGLLEKHITTLSKSESKLDSSVTRLDEWVDRLRRQFRGDSDDNQE